MRTGKAIESVIALMARRRTMRGVEVASGELLEPLSGGTYSMERKFADKFEPTSVIDDVTGGNFRGKRYFALAAKQYTDLDRNPPVQPCPLTRSCAALSSGDFQGSRSGWVSLM